MFESRISAGSIEKLVGWEKSHANTIAWSYDMEGQAKKCVERCCELANNTVECLDDHPFKNERIGNGGRIVKSLLSNRSEMSVLGTHLQTRRSVVREQTGTSNHEMHKSM